MIGLSYDQLKDKILQSSGMTEVDLKAKITDKMDQLSGLISQEGAAHIIANELGIKLFKTEGELKINDVSAGMKNVDVTGKIIRKYEMRTFQTNGRSGKVASMLLGDETGIVRVALWNEQADKFNHLSEGDVLKIKSAMVRHNNDRVELHINAQSKLMLNPEGVKIDAKETQTVKRKKLNELTEEDSNVEVLGTIVQVYDLRFWESCAECNKRATQKDGMWVCATHGQIKPDYNYVLNSFLDDGTESMRVTFWKNQIQNLLQKSDEEIQEFRTNPASFEVVKTELLGNIIRVVGRAKKNEQINSLEFTANVVFVNPDPKDELKTVQSTNLKTAQPIDIHKGAVDPPMVEQRPTPEKISFDTPVPMRDKAGIDDDLVSIEDLEELDELDEM